ncbi:hypothetical protein ACFLUS_01710 [Chloroflexota bacterium]
MVSRNDMEEDAARGRRRRRACSSRDGLRQSACYYQVRDRERGCYDKRPADGTPGFRPVPKRSGERVGLCRGLLPVNGTLRFRISNWSASAIDGAARTWAYQAYA